MTRILKPISAETLGCLDQIFAQYFREERGMRIVERSLGNDFTGRIDLLATDGARVYLITIGTGEFPRCLFRSFTGYRWFRENRDFLGRIYSPEEIDVTLPACLIILSQDIPPGAPAVCKDVCTVPVLLYRYILLGAPDDPDISVESLAEPEDKPVIEPSPDVLRKKLGIGPAGLSDAEILDFRAAMGPFE